MTPPRKYYRSISQNLSRGFTLLELMAVLAVMALLSAVVSLSLASVSERTTLQDAVGAITDMDRSMRNECTEFSREGKLRFDPDNGRITRIAHRDGEEVDVESYRLPESLRLNKVWTRDQESPRRHSRPVVIRCDTHGRSPTYAISIHANTPESNEPKPGVIFVVAGLTGQVQECEDESQIIELFAAF